MQLPARPTLRSLRSAAIPATAVAALLCADRPALGLTAAGVVIQNQATATYEDSGGNTYTAQSNLAEITVQQVYAADIARNLTRDGAAGQPVYTSHVLTNTGNGVDDYTISVAQMTNGAAGDDLDFTRIRVYVDADGDGVPDPGETLIADSTGLTGVVSLDANDPDNKAVALVIEGLAPSAAAGQQVGAVLTATPANGVVNDNSAAIANDGGTQVSDDNGVTPGTNHMLVTLTNDAVVDVTKAAVIDEVNQTIRYTITVINNGGRTAEGVVLYDQLPVAWYDKDGDGVVDTGVAHPDYPGANVVGGLSAADEELVRLPLVGSPVSAGLVNAGDTAATYGTFDEAANGYSADLNGDGSVGAEPWSIYAIDDELIAGATTTMTFTVSYDPALMEALVGNADVPNTPAGGESYAAAATEILNTAYLIGDFDGNPGTTPTVITPSNPTSVDIPESYAIEADDTGDGAGGGADATNDGVDDDGALDDVQTVDTAAEGQTVLFTVPITNNGNVTDPVELAIDPAGTGNFPTGTIFQFWSANNVTQLLDTDGDGAANTPPLAPGETYSMVVRAILPADVNSALTGPFSTTVAAYPSGAPDGNLASTAEAGNTQSNVTLTLSTITQSGVDLSNSVPSGVGDQHDYASGGTTPTTTLTGDPGGTVTFPLWLQNDGVISDSFQIFAGGSWDGGSTTASLGALPSGWSVLFFLDANDDGVADGGAVTTTPTLPGGSTLKLLAQVRISSSSANALSNYSANIDGDVALETVDGNTDGDGDYAILFMIRSRNTDSFDVKLDAVDVNALESFVVATDQSNQIAPGGSTNTLHTVENTGNTPKIFTPSVDNGDVDWTEIVYVDTTGDGRADTPFDTLSVGQTVYIEDPVGGVTAVTLINNNGSPGVPLDPGQILPLTVTVFAPTNAPNGAVMGTVLSVIDEESTTQTNTIVNTVVLGKLRLRKTATLDAACADTATDTLGPDSAFQDSGRSAAPGDCVVWQVVATNTGSQFVEQLVIEDTVPAFTAYVANTLRYCVGDALLDAENDAAENDCAFVDAAAGGIGSVSGDNITFTFAGAAGLGDTSGSPAGNDLDAGAAVTIRFATQVE